MAKLFNLSQVSRSGKSAQSNFSLGGVYNVHSVVKTLEFPNIAFSQGDGGVIINASIIRAFNPENVAFPNFQLHLFEENIIPNLIEGNFFEEVSGFSPYIDLPFVIIDFDLTDIKNGAATANSELMQTAFAKQIIPTSFQCEEGSKSIYGVLVSREGSSYTFASPEIWGVQLSVTY